MLRKDADFEAFERVMVLAHQRHPSASCRTVFCPTTSTLLSGRSTTVN